MTTPPDRSSLVQPSVEGGLFVARSEIHTDIEKHLAELASIAACGHEGAELPEPLRLRARRVHLFFTHVGIAHHMEEERDAFPSLLEHGNAQQRALVRSLQQDHVMLKSLWVQIAPDLDALARGYRWRNMPTFRRSIETFVKLYAAHMAAEESLPLNDEQPQP